MIENRRKLGSKMFLQLSFVRDKCLRIGIPHDEGWYIYYMRTEVVSGQCDNYLIP